TLVFLFLYVIFFFNTTSTTYIYTLSLHDALPIFHLFICSIIRLFKYHPSGKKIVSFNKIKTISEISCLSVLILFCSSSIAQNKRSEEHTSELQSRGHLVCRLLLEKKKKNNKLIKQ